MAIGFLAQSEFAEDLGDAGLDGSFGDVDVRPAEQPFPQRLFSERGKPQRRHELAARELGEQARLTRPGGAGLTRALYGASTEGALPAVVSHEPTLRTAPVDTGDHCVRADSQISKNKKNQRQG